MATGNRQFRAVVLAILVGALASRPVPAQLHSGTASVMLIATLESLSVSASTAAPAGAQAGAEFDGSHPVAITTSWAVPAHRTTVRVVGDVSDVPTAGEAVEAVATAAPASPEAKQALSGSARGGADTLLPGDAERTLMTEGAVSNLPGLHINHINLELGTKAKSQAGFPAKVVTFSIQAEAF